jgi:NADPH:quinone reductase-like Zn-dependent oxidoreductase
MQTIPRTMRAAAIDRFGKPDVLTVHELPVPEIDEREVLIALDAAGVGSWDADMRAGWSPDGPPRFPLVLGTDGAGLVAAVGSSVRRLAVGDPVYSYSFANPKGGFYAEYVAVSAGKAAHFPTGLDMLHAGAVPTIGLTALQGIDNALHVKPGERVIVHGASGGVGHLALQFAKWRGARVLATASGDDGLAFVRRLGADEAVDSRHGDIAAAARSFAVEGVDAALATAGGEALERCLDALRRGGRLAYPNGVDPEPKKRPGIKIVVYDAVPGIDEFERLGRAIAGGRPEIAIAAVYPLDEAAKAHERLAVGHVLGKIVLRIG